MRSVARTSNVCGVNRTGNKPASPDDPDLANVIGEHAEAVRGLWAGRLGQTVRCVPWRRTMMCASGTTTLYAKHYRGRRRACAGEWHWLHMLPLLGIASAQPVAWLADGRSHLIVTAAVAGRSLDAWTVDAAHEGWLDEIFAYACRVVAPFARQLHGHGLIHRDLNLAHLFVVDPQRLTKPTIIDVERVFRPRFRFARWVVKDLASLLASAPVSIPTRTQVEFLRRYAPDLSKRQRRRLGRAILQKVQRIRRHQPRFG